MQSSECGWVRIYLLVLFIYAVFQKDKALTFKQRTVVITTSVLLLVSVMVAMTIAYTPSDVASIIGVQGRYFIPLFAPLFYCMSGDKLRPKFNRKYFGALIWFVYMGVIFEVMNQVAY